MVESMLEPLFRYRYWDSVTYYESDPPRVHIGLEKYRVVKKTPKGAWIVDFGGRRRYVSDGDGKRFAHETISQAWHSFKLRKRNQLKLSENAVERVKLVIQKMDNPTSDQPPSDNFFFSCN